MADLKTGVWTIEEAIQGIRSDGTTRSPIILYDDVAGDTIIRALDTGGSIRFQDAAGDPLALDVNVDWANVQSTPDTLAGYGIADAYTAAAIDALLAGKSNTGHTHAWADVSKTGSSLADLATRSAADLDSGIIPNARIQATGVTQYQAALSIATSQLTGTLPDARVAQTNVTQYEGALSIAWSQITSEPTTLAGYGITDALPLSGGTLTGGLIGTTLSLSTSAALGAHAELTDAGAPSNPAASKARIFPDATAKAIKAVFSDGTTITLGSVGGAISDAYSSIAGDTGSASASGGAQISVLGVGGISTVAADGSPDTLTITLGNHSASLLTSGTIPDAARLPTVPYTKGGTGLTTLGTTGQTFAVNATEDGIEWVDTVPAAIDGGDADDVAVTTIDGGSA